MSGAGSLITGLSASSGMAEELFTTLARSGQTRIERIVSHGQSSPPGFWYDQPWDEFVLLVEGGASVEIEGEAEHRLQPGDWLMIPAHSRHRVVWTMADAATVWLAVHIGETGGPP